jgi:hypothetical protein
MHAYRMRPALPSVPIERLLGRRAYQWDHSVGVIDPPSVSIEAIFQGSLVRFSYFLLDTTTRRLSGAISCRQSHIHELATIVHVREVGGRIAIRRDWELWDMWNEQGREAVRRAIASATTPAGVRRSRQTKARHSAIWPVVGAAGHRPPRQPAPA